MAHRRAEVLVGWKEVADYLGCSVATAARRERDGLPVFRSGGQVRAFPGDIDKWLKGLMADELSSRIDTESVEKIGETEDISAVLATLLKGDSRERLAVIRVGKDVGEFERIEVQLKSAEEKYKGLIEAVPEWVWEMKADGEFTYSSPQVEEILGYEPDDIIGFRLDEFLLHPDEVEVWRSILDELAEKKRILLDHLCRFVHREGSTRYVETSVNPFLDSSGKLTGIRGVSRDVTERVRLQNEIIDTRRYLESVLQGSMDAIVTTDMEGRVKIWNRGAEALYGYTEKEALGKSIDKLTDPPGWTRKFGDLYQIVEASGGSYAEEPVERRRKNGDTVFASATYSIIYGADGKPIGTSGISRDITDRLKAKRFTEEALFRFESVLENVPNVAIAGFGPGGEILHWNRAAERIYGYPASEVLGVEAKFVPFFTGPATGVPGPRGPRRETRWPGREELDHIFSSGEIGEPKEISFEGRSGERRWVYTQMFPVFAGSSVEEVFQTSVDITGIKRAERALEKAAEEWRWTFDAVPNFVAIVDNDYRVLRLNKAMADAIGVEPKEAIGLFCYKAVHGIDRPPESCPHAAVLRNGQEHRVEMYDDKLGRFLEVSISPLKDAQGYVTGSVEVTRDITERVRAEETLRGSEKEKSVILENIPELVVYLNSDMEIVWANKAVADYYGLPNENIIGRRCYELSYGRDALCDDCYNKYVLEAGAGIQVERTTPDGRTWNVKCVPVTDESGAVVGAVEMSTDITERKRATVLAEVQRDLGIELSGKTGLTEAISVCVDAAIKVSGMDAGGIYLVDVSTGALDLAYSVGLSADFVDSASHYEIDSPNARVVGAGKPVYTEYSGLDVPLDEIDKREGLRAVAVVPISHEHKVIACLNVASRKLTEVSGATRTAIEAVASQIGGVIERINAERRLAESEEVYRSLYDTTLALANEMDVEKVIEIIADHATELLRAKDCVVYKKDKARRALVPIYSNDEKNREKIIGFEIPIGVGLSGRVAETGEAAYINISDKDDYSVHVPGTDQTEDENESVMSIPMFGEGEVLGVITVNRARYEFTDEDKEKLTVFARQVEIAVKRAEDYWALRESEEQYRKVVETVNEGVGLVDGRENLTLVNRAFAEMLGYTVDELTGKNLKDITTPKGYKKILEETQKLRAGKRSRYVIEMKHKDGRRFDFLISAVPLSAEDGSYAGAAATIQELPDIGP